jgi:hypothetical protein
MRISTACTLCGGAHVTKRKRNQKEFLNGLKELLEKIAEPNAKLSPQKSKTSDTLFDALQKTVTRAQQNPRNLLQSLTQLVQLATDGKILHQLPLSARSGKLSKTVTVQQPV